jgi:hypothetical protein
VLDEPPRRASAPAKKAADGAVGVKLFGRSVRKFVKAFADVGVVDVREVLRKGGEVFL